MRKLFSGFPLLLSIFFSSPFSTAQATSVPLDAADSAFSMYISEASSAQAASYESNGVTRGYYRTNIDSRAQRIRTSESGGYANIPASIIPTAPVAAAALLSGSGLIALLGLRKKLALN